MASEAIEVVVTETEGALVGLTQQLFGGKINIAQWLFSVGGELKRSHVALAAHGSPDGDLSVGQLFRVGSNLVDEFRYLFGFGTDIVVGKVSEAQAIARIRQYANACRQAYWREYAQGKVVYWRLGVAEHCEDCIELADNSPYRGSELTVYPGSGSTRCRGNCHCYLEER